MTDLYDIPLADPLPPNGVHTWLFFTFALHFLFVLLTVGTALLGVAMVAAGLRGSDPHLEWGRRILHGFFAHKSLAIVLGVAPLLIMMAGVTVPMFTGANLQTPRMIAVIVLLIGSLLLVEYAAECGRTHWKRCLASGVAGVGMLIAVPGIFAAFVVSLENPAAWPAILARDGALPPALSWHWLLRFGHVLGAAVIIGAIYQLLRLAPAAAAPRRILRRWIQVSSLVQVTLGIGLLLTVGERLAPVVSVLVLLGAAGAMAILGATMGPWSYRTGSGATLLAVVTIVVVLSMLLVRQLLQDQALVPLQRRLAVNTELRRAQMEPYREVALDRYSAFLSVVRDGGPAIYAHACSFCHGAVANGQGRRRDALTVPPEDLTALRTSDRHLRALLDRGVPGTGMPPFAFLTAGEVTALLDTLRSQFGLGYEPEPPSRALAEEARRRARAVYDELCVTCHGKEGRGTSLAAGFSPAPPDLTKLGFAPSRTFEVITAGYPGTMMPAFDSYAETTRWGLVAIVQALYFSDKPPANGR